MPHQVLSLLLALFLGAAPSVPAPAAAPSPRIARLELRIQTSAPLTVFRVSTGALLADRVLSNPQGAKLSRDSRGWKIQSSRPATVVLRAAYEETTGAGAIGLRVRTRGGSAKVRVVNASARPFTVSVLSVSRSSPVKAVTLPRARVFGSVEPAVAKPDRRKLVLAAYYPWYGPRYNNPKLADRPADPRSTRNAAGVLAMTKQARAAGIDGFVVSWAGATRNGAGFDLVLDAARRTGNVATVYLETLAANAKGVPGPAPDPAIALAWLRQAHRRSSNPAFLRSGGVPVVFVYQMKALKPWDWAWILKRLRAEGRNLRLVGDAALQNYGANEWGFHRYRPPAAGLAQWNRHAAAASRYLYDGAKLFVATVSPGYDDRRARGSAGTVEPRGAAGETYARAWDAAFASDADWILVTSWNEWFEGTAVEPGVAAGDLALEQTAIYTERFKG